MKKSSNINKESCKNNRLKMTCFSITSIFFIILFALIFWIKDYNENKFIVLSCIIGAIIFVLLYIIFCFSKFIYKLADALNKFKEFIFPYRYFMIVTEILLVLIVVVLFCKYNNVNNIWSFILLLLPSKEISIINFLRWLYFALGIIIIIFLPNSKTYTIITMVFAFIIGTIVVIVKCYDINKNIQSCLFYLFSAISVALTNIKEIEIKKNDKNVVESNKMNIFKSKIVIRIVYVWILILFAILSNYNIDVSFAFGIISLVYTMYTNSL